MGLDIYAYSRLQYVDWIPDADGDAFESRYIFEGETGFYLDKVGAPVQMLRCDSDYQEPWAGELRNGGVYRYSGEVVHFQMCYSTAHFFRDCLAQFAFHRTEREMREDVDGWYRADPLAHLVIYDATCGLFDTAHAAAVYGRMREEMPALAEKVAKERKPFDNGMEAWWMLYAQFHRAFRVGSEGGAVQYR